MFCLFGRDSVTLNQVMVPIAKFSFSESITARVEDLITLRGRREGVWGPWKIL